MGLVELADRIRAEQQARIAREQWPSCAARLARGRLVAALSLEAVRYESWLWAGQAACQDCSIPT